MISSKCHILSTLATYNREFPITKLESLLLQCEMTLNLLQAARCKTKFSVCSYFDGQHDLNKMLTWERNCGWAFSPVVKQFISIFDAS